METKETENEETGVDDEPELGYVPESESKIVRNFLTKFVVLSESSGQSHVNLKLALKALPQKVNLHNLFQVELFSFADI